MIQTRRWKNSLTIAGTVLLVLAAWVRFAVRGLDDGDVRRGLEPLAAMPLKGLQCASSPEIPVAVPNDTQWQRLASAWQFRGILVTAVMPERPGAHTYNLAQLGIAVDVQRSGGAVTCEPEDQPPYGYSASSTGNGVRCQVSPGDVVTIRIRCEPSSVRPPGELAVFPLWDKARVVDANEALAMAPAVRRTGVVAAVLAIVLILAGAVRRTNT
jgi:hypothetical protein